MAERFAGYGGAVASGTDKTMFNLFNSLATPTRRLKIYDLVIGSDDTPADQACRFSLGRTTGVGTEGSGYTPVNIDPAGPAGEADYGIGTFSVEPTYTANKEILAFSLNQRATFRWVAAPGGELMTAATQNNGAGLKSRVSTSTQAYDFSVFHEE